ncbi:MAG: roadblock/LC7 domain-containing protein [Promethearchaeota archaeon]
MDQSKQKLEILNSILNEMKRLGKLEGLIFANRDGGLITQNVSKNVNIHEISSMCASVLESAENLGQTIRSEKLGKIITELDDKTIIIVKCDENTFLTLIINEESKIGLILDQLDKLIKKIIEEYYHGSQFK